MCEATYDTAPVEKEGIQVLVSSVADAFLHLKFIVVSHRLNLLYKHILAAKAP